MLLIIPCTLVLLWLYNLNLDLEKEAKTFPSEFASISDSLQNALLDPVLRIGLEATKAMLLGEEKVGEAVVERKVPLSWNFAFYPPPPDSDSFLLAEWFYFSWRPPQCLPWHILLL